MTEHDKRAREHNAIKTLPWGSSYLGNLPDGCRQCVLGKKLVLFVTGRCARMCYYCPLGSSRKDSDVSFANERPVKRVADVIEEARVMRACGCGVTGGDPLEHLDRTVKFVKALKKEFGNGFHVHLYTNGNLATVERLKKLRAAGVDEIRFHFSVKGVRNALKVGGWRVGAEVPAIPGELEKLKKHVLALERIGAHFINLNELDFSETNARSLTSRGFSLATRFGSSVAESRETALELIKWARTHTKSISIHFCASSVKGSVQLRRRLLRTARAVKLPYESVSRDGLLVKGELVAENTAQARAMTGTLQAGSFKLSGKRIITSTSTARRIAKTHEGIKAFIVKTYPSWDALEVERTPL